MQEVTDYLFDDDVLNIRRHELLHLKWTDRVYEPIQRQILSEISGKDFENLLLHKRLLYNEFLEKSNRQVFISIFFIVESFSPVTLLSLSQEHCYVDMCVYIHVFYMTSLELLLKL